ncbi:MAG: Ig-like domain-containing protein [Pirellulales bacterium]
MTKSNRRPSSVARRSKKVRRPALRLERLENRVVFAGDAPVAWNDVFHTPQDQPLEVSASGVLANDTDNEFDSLTAELFSPPAHGSVELLADGSFRYTPESGFTGLDAFLYRAGDGTSSSKLAAVTLRVDDRQIAPVAQADAYQLDEDTSLTIGGPGVLANDTDADGDTLAATLVTGPEHGTVTLNADGSFTYTPDANFAGTDGFSYIASDGSLSSDAASVTIEVRATPDAPVAANDAFAVDEDGTLVIDAAGVLANDTDADGDALTATLVTGPQHGTVTLNADGSFTYTPDANFAGTDGFSYTAGDGSLSSDAASVTIEVRATPDAPVAANDEFAVDEDGTLVIDAAGVLANDTDADGDALTATLVTGPQHGTVTLNADGSFTYTPDANFAGTDGFSYTAGDGSLSSDAASVTIEVREVIDSPATLGDAYNVGEDNELIVGTDRGVLVNDIDLQDLPLTAELAEGPAHGTVTVAADGSFHYQPEANFFGVDSFTYVASNGSNSSAPTRVNIVVQTINDAPTAMADEYRLGADGTLAAEATAGVVANDQDVEGDTLTATLVSAPRFGTLVLNADGSFLYSAKGDYRGPDSFRYQVNDGMSNGNVVTVSILAAELPATNLPEIPSSEVPDNTTPPAGDVAQEDTPAEGEPTPCHPVVAEPPADALADDSSPCSPWQRTNDDWGWLADVGRRHGHGCAHDWLFSQERWWA